MQLRIKTAQHFLAEAGLYTGAIDGKAGPKTEYALGRSNSPLAAEAILPMTRRITAWLQYIAAQKGIDAGPVDGLWGPRTEYAYSALRLLVEQGTFNSWYRPDEYHVNATTTWPAEGSSDFAATYGPPGSHLVALELPWRHHLSWDMRTRTTRTQCHARVRDSLERVLHNVLKEYGEAEIKRLGLHEFGGCYNHRVKRGGTTLSTHAWGIALDYFPSRNALRWGCDRAVMARPEYDTWWQCWENEGWVSLGRRRNFDWMHVQAAALAP